MNRIKGGASLVPPSLIVLYLLFFILDCVTTYIASPDLKYEGNWLVIKFNLGWLGIIIKDTIIFTSVTSSLILSLSFLKEYSKSTLITGSKDLVFTALKNFKLLISLIIIGVFFSHLINLGHIIINNYLAYIYLHKPDGWLKGLATDYVIKQKYFLFYIQNLLVIPGFLIAIYRIRLINKRIYQNHLKYS